MLNINYQSTACVNFNKYADYVPILSSLTGLTDLFLKHVYRPLVGEAKLQNNHYIAYLDTKSSARSLALVLSIFVPGLASLFFIIKDLFAYIKAEELVDSAKNADRYYGQEKEATSYYQQASLWGSPEADHQLGCRYFYGEKGAEHDPDKGAKYLIDAAARGSMDAARKLVFLGGASLN